ncbi:peptidylprolyl isomerase [Tenacibaculum maritimum]|uniref:peptidylprolyl isomerase n=1 Tax=Tenacibaculum maritimum TaxID=107401 RepID=UPI0012E6BE07|nr:peptidylprolyl isomerase [Tenacibaculum maritimum]CAA0147317.1 Peptidyl-prolyl cis-trans isomerase [Tenacibaculum maritimum]
MKYLKTLIVFAILFSACKAAKYPDLDNGIYADVKTSRGDILLKLYAKDVPMTVANFVSLAEGTHPKMTDSLKGTKFYDGTKFHRVIKDFMIQGGDPLGTGRGNAGYAFADEFPSDSIGRLLYKHDVPGVLSMANSGPKTNSSQFFITHKATPWLDGKHSIFGKVTSGQMVVDSIQQNDRIEHIHIIRIGKEAKKFDAAKVFEEELLNVEEKEKERQKKLEELKKKFQEKMGISKATKTDSGLRFLQIQEGKGKKVNPAQATTVNYTLYTAEGKKIDSTIDKGAPFTFTIDAMGMIAGWKEGVKMMREGEKARLFIPDYLGYGKRGAGPIPPSSDLIFEIEILKVGK